ncbi:MAG: YdbH domain-containing protein [Geminicoccaceae bacterium]|nr:YdbH domain-containing protein [Geminicoccaceae bacterium]
MRPRCPITGETSRRPEAAGGKGYRLARPFLPVILVGLALATTVTDGHSASAFSPRSIHIGQIAITGPHGERGTIDGVDIDRKTSIITLGRLRIDALGGRAMMDGLELTPEGSRGSPVLWLDGISLRAIADTLALPDFSGDGLFDGNLPFHVGADLVPAIDSGMVMSRQPGIIRYRPSGNAPTDTPAEAGGMALLMQALENFHYDRLTLTVDGKLDGSMQAGLQLAGRNPDLYGGHPFDLNVNLEGALAGLVRQVLDSYRLPDILAGNAMDFIRRPHAAGGTR